MTAEEAHPIEDETGGGGTKLADRMKRVVQLRISTLLWGGVVLAAVLLFVGLLYFQYRPDQATNDVAGQGVLAAAKDGTVAVYTYSADTLDRDISSAQSHLTGDFLSEYQQYAQSPATAVTKQNAVKTSAQVVGSALVELRSGSADVLLFINQITTTAKNPGPLLASRSVLVKLLKVDGKWLISSLKPV